jgi:hypothetical protein
MRAFTGSRIVDRSVWVPVYKHAALAAQPNPMPSGTPPAAADGDEVSPHA